MYNINATRVTKNWRFRDVMFTDMAQVAAISEKLNGLKCPHSFETIYFTNSTRIWVPAKHYYNLIHILRELGYVATS